jgi:hypothetical protein
MPLMLGGAAGQELLIGYTRLGNPLAPLDRARIETVNIICHMDVATESRNHGRDSGRRVHGCTNGPADEEHREEVPEIQKHLVWVGQRDLV